MSPLISGVSGLRGVMGDGLTPEVICSHVCAFGSIYSPKVVVGRDTRPTGQTVESLVTALLSWVGCESVLLGVTTTPTTQIAVEKLEADGGIVITASHNPVEWNALKFISHTGSFLNSEELDALNSRIRSENFNYVKWSSIGKSTHYPDANQDHKRLVLDLPQIDVGKIREANLKVAVDCVNGAASLILPELLKDLGCRVVELNCTPDGIFPHNPEPLQENLGDLIELVKESGADIGFAVDPDGDRLSVIADGGLPLSEEYTLVLAAEAVLSGMRKEDRKIVTNLSTTRAVEDVAGRYGASILRTPVGEINVVEGMKSIGAVLGGEGNGGVILSDAHYGRDSLVGAALVLQFLVDKGRNLSDIYSEMPQYVMLKRKIDFAKMDTDSVLNNIAVHFAGADVDMSDGVKVNKPEGWVHVRPSNTEPILRIYSEAKTKETASAFANEVEKIVGAG